MEEKSEGQCMGEFVVPTGSVRRGQVVEEESKGVCG